MMLLPILPFFVEEKGLILIGHLLPITSLNSQCSSFFSCIVEEKGLSFGFAHMKVTMHKCTGWQ
jgi:hypothetical protein